MAIGGLSPLIIFNFYKITKVPAFLKGFVNINKLPLVPIGVYLNESLLNLALDDWNRDISIDVMRDGVTSFERVSGDVATFKILANKNNIGVTGFTAIFDRILKLVETKEYSISIFYDNIFILDAALENFNTRLRDGTDLREISFTLAKRPEEEKAATTPPLARFGSAAGIN